MVVLNFLLFVPYGFLLSAAFPESRISWKGALAAGGCSSLFIELFQAVSGRLCEIDDLIANTGGFLAGFLLFQALKKICSRESRKNGLIQAVLTAAISGAVLFLLSFWANGDAVQRQEDAYYTEIGNSEKETEAICKFNILCNGKSFDALKGSSTEWETWYSWMGNGISNNAGNYNVGRISSDSESMPVQDAGKTYMEIAFDSPQLFRFYNNKQWSMENVWYMLFCVEDGTVWYGSRENALEFCAQYVSVEYPYTIDQQLMDEISDKISE